MICICHCVQNSIPLCIDTHLQNFKMGRGKWKGAVWICVLGAGKGIKI